jgi:hypothetical protein
MSKGIGGFYPHQGIAYIRVCRPVDAERSSASPAGARSGDAKDGSRTAEVRRHAGEM